MSSVQTPNHQITIFCLGIIWGSWKWTFLWDVVLESSLSHCATKVKEALTVAVLTEIRSAFNILQLFYTMFNCFQTCFPRWFALSSASVFAAVVLCVDFWHKAIGLKLAMLKQFESDQGRLKARSSSHRLREKAGDIWWHLVTFGDIWWGLTLTGYRCFGNVSGEAASSQPDAWKILEDLGRSWKILEDLGRLAMAVGGQQVAVLLSLCIFCGFRWFRWLCTGLLMFVASRWRVSDSGQRPNLAIHLAVPGSWCLSWLHKTLSRPRPRRSIWLTSWKPNSHRQRWDMVRHGETWWDLGHLGTPTLNRWDLMGWFVKFCKICV